MCENGDWLEEFTEITMLALQRKPKATKCSDHPTISLVAHVRTAKFSTIIMRRRVEKEIEDVRGIHQV
jgi:hypothetical protein